MSINSFFERLGTNIQITFRKYKGGRLEYKDSGVLVRINDGKWQMVFDGEPDKMFTGFPLIAPEATLRVLNPEKLVYEVCSERDIDWVRRKIVYRYIASIREDSNIDYRNLIHIFHRKSFLVNSMLIPKSYKTADLAFMKLSPIWVADKIPHSDMGEFCARIYSELFRLAAIFNLPYSRIQKSFSQDTIMDEDESCIVDTVASVYELIQRVYMDKSSLERLTQIVQCTEKVIAFQAGSASKSLKEIAFIAAKQLGNEL